ncbi:MULTISPECIES: flavodoxin family protein [unclassified Janthinobacterium]|uniref:flavodoxin family protein n=1 Tax=unclassified Janthinobacterium TaxID=2610881 RepID=UPI00162055F5|nr:MULTISPECIES: flavodoxin family protein [unclassified Janthinobacterium]MBB5366919.1 multimeric flavodoxin WrbA [Janthinobacterium sp. K2C7]MBB5380603.1 multimeric flavodoxin WrbA [Janthinobacterium sp. K2Li3]MBB5385301.1 multimeric flavodoxin WrbA [Janthinobacterium sp. K2E3]
MTSIAIVYFSGYGHTVKQAEAVQAGAASVAGAQVHLYRIDQNGDLHEEALAVIGKADAVIYGSPTYMGGPAWQFKKFADKSSSAWFGQDWKNKLAAGFTNSASLNGDKFSTIQYFWTLAMQHSQIWVGTGILPSNKKEHGPADVNWSAGFGGALAISPSDASPDEAPRSGDLEMARLLGKRVAELAAKLK